ncbi:vanadium-dependent haloperoxidase [Rubrivirga litoralis]|uniref:Vanadium-dependent haloperoxidase n=1 Tax=Rubrivirga litoralis TaxID=3075598 RepID=A0ABU3BM11_9BACT|nr:vanadium-dependent haloperoxidase [Rubrivirga sp. F394]MDT0630261.1 vanadium-dependent haloperoxidase [Rubrivirga sp. F394]
MTRPALLLVGAVLLAACAEPALEDVAPAAADPELLHGVVLTTTETMTHDIFSPPQASRVYAYQAVAAHEALAAVTGERASLAGQLRDLSAPPAPPDAPVHGPTAALSAALAVAEALTFSDETVAAHREAVEVRLREGGVAGALAERSAAYGEAVAQHVLAWAAGDQYAQTRSAPAYTVTDEPGTWRPTPPAYLDAIEPSWGRLRPFVLDSAAQFKPPRPHAYSLAPGSAFRREVDEVYEVGVGLTDEQREIASFWDCNPYTMHTRGHAMFATKKLTPGGHWMGIAAIASRQAGDDFASAAEAYARTALALSDGFISVWDEKYRSRLIRPETVINEHIDEAWAPLLQTPPFPEYSSGHSVVSAAAAEALTALYGEPFAFDDTTEVAYGLPVRRFASFRAAAEEAAISRLYGGIHYRMAAEHGVEQGRGVGRLHVDRLQTRPAAVAEARGTRSGTGAGRSAE